MSLKRSPRTGINWQKGAAVLLIVGVGGIVGHSALQQSRQSAPIAVQHMTAERGQIEEIISERGVVQYARQTTLRSSVEGTVGQVRVGPGEDVIVGQTLAVLLTPTGGTTPASQPSELAQQTAALERSQERLADAEDQLAAYQSDLERLSEPEAETEETPPQSDPEPLVDLAELESNISRAEAELEAARSEAEEARQALEQVRSANRPQPVLQETAVTAPFSGQVLDVMVNPGDGAGPRTALITLADPSQELVRLDLSTEDAARIELGQPTRISFADSDADFPGRVVEISSSAQSSEAGGEATVPTLVRLGEPTRSLVFGGEVNVEIILESRENVTVLSTEAIQQRDGNPFVWVSPNQQQVQRRPIQIGLEGIGQVEIEAGLRPGETVIVPKPGQELAAGDAVVIESAP